MLAVLGSINADRFIAVDRLPQPGETIAGSALPVLTGGKGCNQAGAAARLGCPTRFHGRIGDDADGVRLRADLAATGCDVSTVASAPGPTGQALILLQSGGQNSIILAPGANHAWPAQLPAACAADIAASRLLLLQCEVPPAVNRAAAAAAAAAGVPILLDAGGDEAAWPYDLLPLLATVSPNETELARITGMPTGNPAEVEAAARAVQRRGAAAVLVKLGARGALLVERDRAPLHQPARAVPVVDTTGAGDCFTAAYAVALLEGMPAAARLRFACAAASLCVQARGALPAMPSRAAVEAALAAGG